MLSLQPNRRVELHDAALLVSDLDLNDPHELLPLLRLIDDAAISSLLLVANDVSAPVVAALLAAGHAPRPCQIIAVKAPSAVTGQAAMLDDLALLTGARPLLRAAGDTLRGLRPHDLGRARRAWADDEFFGVVGGKGAPRALEEPTRTILHNAGYDVGHALGCIERAGPGYGFDVLAGEAVDMVAAGIIDSAGVLGAALHGAIASAALALTVDVLVHKGVPEVSFEP